MSHQSLTSEQVKLIHLLVSSGVLRFGEFKTKSGRLSPYFLNFGHLDTGTAITQMGEFFARKIAEMFPDRRQSLCIFGPAYKGISLAVSTAMSYQGHFPDQEVFFCFNRKESKAHGEKGLFIGHQPTSAETVIVIDDVLTGGTSIRESLDLLGSLSIKPDCALIGVNREEVGLSDKKARQELEEDYKCPVHELVNMTQVCDYLSTNEIDGKLVIDTDIMTSIKKYREKYQ